MSVVSSLPRRASFVGSRSEWFAVGPDLWVAVSSGMHRGRIEGGASVFVAVDDVNALVGRYGSLREAMAAVDGSAHSSAAA